MSTLRHADEIAVVVGDHRVVVLDLDHLDEPPVILTDSAAAIWEAVDGRLDDEASSTGSPAGSASRRARSGTRSSPSCNSCSPCI